MSQAYPKTDYIRSRALLVLAREIACQHCGASDSTVCAAHSNEARHGKGRSIKASDQYIASLCHSCHSDLDQGSRMSRAERTAMWWRAHVKTVRELVRRGLWPATVPLPDIREFDA